VPALDGYDLLAPDVALLMSFPHHLVAVALPAAVVDPDRHPRSHQVDKQQREGQADWAAAADGDPQDGLGVKCLGDLLRANSAKGDGYVPRTRQLEAELLARDHDLITRPEVVGGNPGTVHPGAILAAPVGDDIAIGFLPEHRVQPRDRGIGDDDVTVLVTAERDRLAADREALASQVTSMPHDGSFHRAATSPLVRLNRLTSLASTVSPQSARLHVSISHLHVNIRLIAASGLGDSKFQSEMMLEIVRLL